MGLDSPDGFNQEHMAKRSATTWTSYFGQHWDEFSIDHIRTTFVRIEVLEVYSTSNNGFIEVEFYTGISKSSLIVPVEYGSHMTSLGHKESKNHFLFH